MLAAVAGLLGSLLGRSGRLVGKPPAAIARSASEPSSDPGATTTTQALPASDGDDSAPPQDATAAPGGTAAETGQPADRAAPGAEPAKPTADEASEAPQSTVLAIEQPTAAGSAPVAAQAQDVAHTRPASVPTPSPAQPISLWRDSTGPVVVTSSTQDGDTDVVYRRLSGLAVPDDLKLRMRTVTQTDDGRQTERSVVFGSGRCRSVEGTEDWGPILLALRFRLELNGTQLSGQGVFEITVGREGTEPGEPFVPWSNTVTVPCEFR